MSNFDIQAAVRAAEKHNRLMEKYCHDVDEVGLSHEEMADRMGTVVDNADTLANAVLVMAKENKRLRELAGGGQK